eukprot:scaffold16562_cov134-Isochrysis_galbana.AAC.1
MPLLQSKWAPSTGGRMAQSPLIRAKSEPQSQVRATVARPHSDPWMEGRDGRVGRWVCNWVNSGGSRFHSVVGPASGVVYVLACLHADQCISALHSQCCLATRILDLKIVSI